MPGGRERPAGRGDPRPPGRPGRRGPPRWGTRPVRGDPAGPSGRGWLPRRSRHPWLKPASSGQIGRQSKRPLRKLPILAMPDALPVCRFRRCRRVPGTGVMPSAPCLGRHEPDCASSILMATAATPARGDHDPAASIPAATPALRASAAAPPTTTLPSSSAPVGQRGDGNGLCQRDEQDQWHPGRRLHIG